MMASSSDSHAVPNSYIADPEDLREMARLILQDQFVTKQVGDVFSERQWGLFRHVLDIGCGPGSWLLEMARLHPDIKGTGIDVSKKMLQYARMLADAENNERASFLEMDARERLEFSDASFGLINGRMMHQFLLPEKWSDLMLDCFRLLRPGGILQVTEYEVTLSNSTAHTRLSSLFDMAVYRAGRSFSPSGRSQGITPMLKKLVGDAGFVDIQQQASVLDSSSGSEAFEVSRENFVLLNQTYAPFSIKHNGITWEEIQQLVQQGLEDMKKETFCCLTYFLTVRGTKPPRASFPNLDDKGDGKVNEPFSHEGSSAAN